MKLLTATAETQGLRKNDFDWTVEGELVCLGFVCARDERDPDGGCGCGRSFSGMSSHRATTSAMVRDLPMSWDDLRIAFVGYLQSAGYLPSGEPEDEELIGGAVDEIIAMAAPWPVGAVLGRRLDALVVRTEPGP